jgi:SIR2-like domain
VNDENVFLAAGLPGLPLDLMLARDRGEVLFLTGAGVSRPPPSCLPDFRGLVLDICEKVDKGLAFALTQMIDDARAATAAVPPRPLRPWTDFTTSLDPGQKAEFKRFVDGDYDVALGMMERRQGSAGRGSRMRAAAAEVLGVRRRPNAVHKAIDRLARREGRLFLATTNFDRLHEIAAGIGVDVPSYGLSDLPRPSRRADFRGVFHIHGLLPDKTGASSELILTDQDFGDYYMRRRVTSDFVYDATRIYYLVIVGYSVNDAPMRYLLNAVAGDQTHFPDLKTRYALVPVEGSDDHTAADWKNRGIEPLCYAPDNAHAELPSLLKAWADSIPDPLDDRWLKRRLRVLAKSSVAAASEADRSVFNYLIRRSTPQERVQMLAQLSGFGGGHDWLTEAHRITREVAA